MAKSISLNIPLTEKLKEFINSQAGDDTMYSTASEYVRDLIRHDYEKKNRIATSNIPRDQQDLVLERLQRIKNNPDRLKDWNNEVNLFKLQS